MVSRVRLAEAPILAARPVLEWGRTGRDAAVGSCITMWTAAAALVVALVHFAPETLVLSPVGVAPLLRIGARSLNQLMGPVREDFLTFLRRLGHG
jgi:hypothetical protein